MMIASASMLFAATTMEDNSSMAQGRGMGQGGKSMMSHGKYRQDGMHMMHGKKMGKHGKNMRKKGKNDKKMMHSPFLIKHGLPHMSKLIMRSWDDPVFGLTAEQKSKLEGIRKRTMGSTMNIKKEILPLTKSILSGVMSGKTADELKDQVKKLGELEAEATIIQIRCIEETKNVLTKDQLIYLLQKSMQHKQMKKKYH